MIVATPSRAIAQSSAAGQSAATAQRERGLAFLRAGDAPEAVRAFEQSLAIFESPNTRLDLGRALLATGRVASAVRELERARDTARAQVDAGQRHYLLTARAALAECDAARARVPLVEIHFSRTPPTDAEIWVDAVRLPASALIAPVPVDPGSLTIRLAGPSVREVSLVRTVAEGERITIDVVVERIDPVATVVAASAAPVASPAPIRAERVRVSSPGPSPGLPRPALRLMGTAVGIGGLVAASVGLALWLVADGEYNALVRACPSGPCTDPTLLARAGSAQGIESAGVIALVAGGALMVTGAALLVTGLVPGGETRPGLSLAPNGLLVRF